MSIGIIISMYDEIEEVKSNVSILKKIDCKIIVAQSDPGNVKKKLEASLVDSYNLFPDLAGDKETYLKERQHGTAIPARALTRNLSYAFSESKKFDCEWWITILGDIQISSLKGIKRIISKMTLEGKKIGITRAIGQTFLDDNDEYSRIQKSDSTDFMPQFFIVKSELIKNGLFNDIKITNKFATEQCLGDEVVRYCNENNTEFKEICHIISNYAYPQFIEGLQYNKDKVKMPRYIDSIVNVFRRIKMDLGN